LIFYIDICKLIRQVALPLARVIGKPLASVRLLRSAAHTAD